MLNECSNHFYHKQCLIDYAESCKVSDKYVIRCCVWGIQYGSTYGDMPKGKMAWEYEPNMHCEGFEGEGTYVINYKVDGKYINIKYSHRCIC